MKARAGMVAGAVLTGLASAAAELPLHKSRGQWALEGKYFHLSDGESLSLYGVSRRHFLTDGWYWGEAGYGAVAGHRGGYFEGGAVIGCQAVLWRELVAEARLFSGAGGGGNVPEGGGWLVEPAAGLGFGWSSRWRFVAQAGYARFLNGSLRGWTGAAALHYAFWDLR